MVEHIDDERAKTDPAGRSRLVPVGVFQAAGRHGLEAGMTTLTQVRKPLSVLGEPEADAAVKCPQRRVDLLREYLRDPDLPYLCLTSFAIVPLYALGCPATPPPSRQTILDSTQPCCLPCNLKQGDVFPREIHGLSLIEGISEYQEFLPYLLP
jgi:hypothetical protein